MSYIFRPSCLHLQAVLLINCNVDFNDYSCVLMVIVLINLNPKNNGMKNIKDVTVSRAVSRRWIRVSSCNYVFYYIIYFFLLF